MRGHLGINQLIILLAAFSLALTLVNPSDRCRFRDLVHAFEQSATGLPHPNRVRVNGKNYSFQNILQRSTALVFRSTDRSHVVKIYTAKDIGLARYEYYATKFLRERGFRVAAMPEPVAENARLEQETKNALMKNGMAIESPVVVVKDYAEGFPFSETSQPPLPSESLAEVNIIQRRMVTLFKDGSFREWLARQGVDPKKEGLPEKYVDESDIALKDFVRTENGWTLIDP